MHDKALIVQYVHYMTYKIKESVSPIGAYLQTQVRTLRSLRPPRFKPLKWRHLFESLDIRGHTIVSRSMWYSPYSHNAFVLSAPTFVGHIFSSTYLFNAVLLNKGGKK